MTTSEAGEATDSLPTSANTPAGIADESSLSEQLAARDKEIERLKEAAHKLIDYCEDHNWGTMPEPFDSINPLLKLLGRDSTPTKEQ